MWLYLGAFIVLVGAELNSEIEQARSGRGGRRTEKQDFHTDPASAGARRG